MAEQSKADALFKAACNGDAAKVRAHVAAGVPIESTDLHRMTPIMIAAQAGQLDTFRALVELGANLKVVRMGQTDLLESAAEGGNVEIIRFLIDKGLPLEGQWQPKSPVLKRMGHITALQMAAMYGHVEAARVLLAAGADKSAKFDGQTALQRAEDDIKHPIGDQASLKPRYLEIVALLKRSDSVGNPPADFIQDVQQFEKNARMPAYLKLRKSLDKRCGSPRPWKPQLDHGIRAAAVVRYKLAPCKKQEELEQLQTEAEKAGCQLVLSEMWMPGEDAALVLFPTRNKFAVIAAVGISGENESVRTEDVIQCLLSVENTNPFDLTFCGHDFVGGAFRRALKGAAKLAAQLVELCPECLDDDECSTPEELAVALKNQRSLLLRWG